MELFKKKLSDLSEAAENKFFVMNVASILKVIDKEKSISKEDIQLVERMYDAFLNDTLANPSDFKSYLNRERTLIVAWVSPTDSVVSFSWLRLPKNWDEKKEYPLYVQLHGRWDVAENPISYMSYTFVEAPSTTTAFEDGYFLSPWGRGNQWYLGISKTDIWECISEFEKIAKVDPKRKYLSGHSMGGYGTWHIAQESKNTWAAIGIHSGAFNFYNKDYITIDYANNLKNMPTYFVWGDKEISLKEKNIEAHRLLKKAGNENLNITVFKGGHDYNEVDVENMYNWMRKFKKE